MMGLWIDARLKHETILDAYCIVQTERREKKKTQRDDVR